MRKRAVDNKRKWLHDLEEGDRVRLVTDSGKDLGIGVVALVQAQLDQLIIRYPVCGARLRFSRSIGLALDKNHSDHIEQLTADVETPSKQTAAAI